MNTFFTKEKYFHRETCAVRRVDWNGYAMFLIIFYVKNFDRNTRRLTIIMLLQSKVIVASNFQFYFEFSFLGCNQTLGFPAKNRRIRALLVQFQGVVNKKVKEVLSKLSEYGLF